ncbi:MAG: hypothetical protein SP4CHLAM5_09600 [Chlamydiia bacterium]|nr:hypothetical protein [Chlamydiia bacterium]MCH9618818.1 hypothetical protein [Chlamydiia bacterium]MCH9624665.1 hypothetical protein [Chlamydiia bacterium]
MTEAYPKCRQPLILRYHRLLEVFSKSNDVRDFYLDKVEGFLVFYDLDKGEEELALADAELKAHPDRFCSIPKLTYYETRKFMEGFVTEKVYDIDTKEKLLEIIGARGARENFLEFVYDNLTELDKWQQYYQERSRVRVIEWLRDNEVVFVFEEDLDLPTITMEKLKEHKFSARVSKDVSQARDVLDAKSKTYYSSDALNPRPKRGRPPKQQAKLEVEPELAGDFYTTVPSVLRMFLFAPDFSNAAAMFSEGFDTEEKLLASMKGSTEKPIDMKLHRLSQRLESLKQVSDRLKTMDVSDTGNALSSKDISEDTDKESKGLSSLLQGVIPKRKTKQTLKERAMKSKEKMKEVTRIRTRKPKK